MNNSFVFINRVVYNRKAKDAQRIRLFVAEAEFDRDMSQFAKEAKKTRTVAFPSTVR